MRIRLVHIKAIFNAIRSFISVIICLPLLMERQKFLISEVRRLRIQLNEDRGKLWPTIRQTKDSFNYQWKNLPDGRALPSDKAWIENIEYQIEDFFDEPHLQFKGKTVLDYGCGGGRYALGFAQLGADVYVYDQSPEIERSAIDLCAKHGYQIQSIEKQYFRRYDYVWCFGVVHHTGQTYHYISEVVQRVKPGGKLFLMVYGVPQTLPQYIICNYYEDIRNKTATMTFDQRLTYLQGLFPKDDVHGMFDVISPQIADLVTWQELHGLLKYLGMDNIKRTLKDHRNHFVVARRNYYKNTICLTPNR